MLHAIGQPVPKDGDGITWLERKQFGSKDTRTLHQAKKETAVEKSSQRDRHQSCTSQGLAAVVG